MIGTKMIDTKITATDTKINGIKKLAPKWSTLKWLRATVIEHQKYRAPKHFAKITDSFQRDSVRRNINNFNIKNKAKIVI